MGNSRSFKEKYKGVWKDASQKEKRIAKLIAERLMLATEPIGFGATSDEYIEGSGVENGFEKCAADLRVKDTNVVIEVSGPLKQMDPSKPLWISKAKIAYARANINRMAYLFCHVNGVDGEVRWIHIGKQFLYFYDQGAFRTNNFENGMVLVDALDFLVMSQDTGLHWINMFAPGYGKSDGSLEIKMVDNRESKERES